MNQFNDLHGEELNEPPRECNIQPTVDHFKSKNYTPKISPVVSTIIGIINDNNIVEVHPLECLVEFNSESNTDKYTTSIKSINDDEMEHLL